MKKSKVEEFLGKRVTVELKGGDILTGKFCKTGTEELRDENMTLFLTRNYYFIEFDYDISYCFRSSYIKKIELTKN